MGTVIPEATFLSALGASPYAAEATLPAFFGEGLLGAGAAASAAPGTIESMAGLQYLNGNPLTMGAKLSSLGGSLMPGEWDWMKKGKLGLEGLKMMQGEQPQQQQQAPVAAPIQRQQGAPVGGFLEAIRANNDDYFRGPRPSVRSR